MLKQLLLYFTVTFVLEEVAFRGALDSYTYQPQLMDKSTAAQLGFPQFSCRLYRVFGTCPYFPLVGRQHSQLRSRC